MVEGFVGGSDGGAILSGWDFACFFANCFLYLLLLLSVALLLVVVGARCCSCTLLTDYATKC